MSHCKENGIDQNKREKKANSILGTMKQCEGYDAKQSSEENPLGITMLNPSTSSSPVTKDD